MTDDRSAAPLLIVGFHRSGTSAVARMFHTAGVDLGSSLLGAEPANPHGHFEDVEVVSLHDTFLARAGLTWKSLDADTGRLPEPSASELAELIQRRDAPGHMWGAKDPRLCLFLDSWLRIAPDARVVVVFRRPDEAIRSLHMRHSRRHVDTRGTDPSDLDFWRLPDLGIALWIHYHRRLLSSLETARNLHVVDFSDRASLERLVSTLADRWDLALNTSTVPDLDPHLGKPTDSPVEVRSPQLLEDATSIWSALQTLRSSH